MGFAHFKRCIRILHTVENLDDTDQTLFVAFPIFTGIEENGIVLEEKSTSSEVKVLKSAYLDRLYGVFLIVLSAISFGTMAIFARIAYEAGSDPITVLFLRFTIAGIFMLAIMVAKGMAYPRGRTLVTLALMGALGYVGLSFAFFTALTMAPAGQVAILLYLYPAFVTLLATIFLKKPVTLLKFVALSLTFGGTMLIIGMDGGRGQNLGIILAITAAVLYSIYIIVGSKVISKAGAFSSLDHRNHFSRCGF